MSNSFWLRLTGQPWLAAAQWTAAHGLPGGAGKPAPTHPTLASEVSPGPSPPVVTHMHMSLTATLSLVFTHTHLHTRRHTVIQDHSHK